MRTIHFFLDFDGTIASVDAVDRVLERFADKRWKDVEQEWVAGKIGSRECLTRQVQMIKATPEQVLAELDSVTLDPHFVGFVKKAEELGVLVTIVSDGFDLFIEHILKKNLQNKSGVIKGLPIFSNKLIAKDGGFEARFPTDHPCEHGCANCKQALIKKLTSADDHIFFVGDGYSDRFAAKRAHLTFAKDKLLAFCRENDIDHIPYDDFKKIETWLTDSYPMLKKTRVVEKGNYGR